MVFARLIVAGLSLALLGNAPTPEQIKGEYKQYVFLREIDNRCPTLSYADRVFLNDSVLAAFVSIPEVKAVAGSLGTPEFSEVVETVVEPMSEEAKDNAYGIPCDAAPRGLNRVRFGAAAAIIGHIREDEELFKSTASPIQIQLASQMFGILRQAAETNPPGTVERAIAGQMTLSGSKGKGAVARARYLLDLYILSTRLELAGYDLRWDNKAEGWQMYQRSNGRTVARMIFAKPFLATYYGLSNKEDQQYFDPLDPKGKIVVLPGMEDASYDMVVLSQLPDQVLPELGASVSRSYLGEHKARKLARGCPEQMQCFRFTLNTRNVLKRFAEGRDSYRGAEIAFYESDASMRIGNGSPAKIRDRAKIPEPIDYLPVRKMFPKPQEE